MMFAAIYARKSTDQTGVAEEAKSVTRQVERARAYAAMKGWTIVGEHVYTDHGISGAEFERRLGLQALLSALSPRAPFQILIVMDKDRLGREMYDALPILKRLSEAGVRVFEYLKDREVLLDTPTNKLIQSIEFYAAEAERDQASRRVKDALTVKARAGHVVGGRRFGYTNMRIDGHVEKQVNPTEAPTVIKMFELAVQGFGCRRIAARLNDEGHPTPRGAWWSASTVRDALRCETYRGVVVWNKTAKRDAWGKRRHRRRPADDWISAARPALRIVSDELWAAARARVEESRATFLRASGRQAGTPINGIESQHLLIGLGSCYCNRGLTARRGRYMCLGFVKGGKTACGNNMKLALQAADEAVLSAVEDQVLRPEVIAVAIQEAVRRLRPEEDQHAERRRLESAVAKVEAELARLVGAIKSGTNGGPETLVRAIEDVEGERNRLRGALASLDALKEVAHMDAARLEQDLRARLVDWRSLMVRHGTQARQILRTLLVGRLRFTPNDRGCEFEGEGQLEPLVGTLATAGSFLGGLEWSGSPPRLRFRPSGRRRRSGSRPGPWQHGHFRPDT